MEEFQGFERMSFRGDKAGHRDGFKPKTAEECQEFCSTEHCEASDEECMERCQHRCVEHMNGFKTAEECQEFCSTEHCEASDEECMERCQHRCLEGGKHAGKDGKDGK